MWSIDTALCVTSTVHKSSAKYCNTLDTSYLKSIAFAWHQHCRSIVKLWCDIELVSLWHGSSIFCVVLPKRLRGTAVSPTLPHLELIQESEGHNRAAHFRQTAKACFFLRLLETNLS